MNGPRWIKQWIADLALLNEQFRNDDGSVDFEALGREEYMFRTALITQKLEKSDRARDIYMKAKAAYDASSENGKKGGRPKKNQETTADGDTREDSQAKPDGSAITRNETRAHDALEPSANNYGVAPHREARDVSATDSKNMRRVPQNEAPAHGFSGGRTAQGTMSRSPEAAAQSGKAYDQETDQVSTRASNPLTGKSIPAPQTDNNSATTPNESTDEPAVVTARQSKGRTGAPVRGATSSTAPVRSYRPRKVPHPKGDYEVFDFASENGIPDWVASEFYQRFFVERDGTDTDGNNIDNWKGALINYNKSRKREPA